MKTTQYVRQEQAIAAADRGGIRERWMWGLRLLRDPDAFAPGSSQLKPGRAEELIKAHAAAGRRISQREVQYRLQCARTYRTETQIAHACAQFEDWSALRSAGFPPFEAADTEAPADHRTAAERDRDRARALADQIGTQGALFPLADFEPTEATLKDLVDYADQQEAITERFVRHGQKRRAYLDRLVEAAGGDLSVTWLDAHERLDDGTSVAA